MLWNTLQPNKLMPLVTPVNGETISRRKLLFTAAAGLLGALLMFTGDMFLYGHLGSGADFSSRYKTVIAGASTLRLYVAGALGPVAAIFYLIGARHLSLRLEPAKPLLRVVTSFAFVATFVVAGAVHAVWATYALVMRGVSHGHASPELQTVVWDYLQLLFRMAEVVGYPAALLLFLLVLMRQTTYPRWSAVLNPGVAMLAAPLFRFLPSPIGAPVVGGLFNLAFVVFFSMSLATREHSQYPDASG
jgi:hypothetical protein